MKRFLPGYLVLWSVAVIIAAGLLVPLPGCETSHFQATGENASATFDKPRQDAITPDAALKLLMEGNHRFVTGTSLHRDYPSQVKATAGHQYPFAVVLSCMDSRSSPEIVFDRGIGDLFVTRMAGNYAPVDILGSMEYATEVAARSWSWCWAIPNAAHQGCLR